MSSSRMHTRQGGIVNISRMRTRRGGRLTRGDRILWNTGYTLSLEEFMTDKWHL